jgi:hypothetical protein
VPPSRLPLCGPAGGNPVGGRRVDIERANHRFAFQEVLYRFLYFLIFGTVIFLRVLPRFPKTQRQYAIVLFVRDQNCLIDEAFLFLEDGQYYVVDGVGELFVLDWFSG